MCLLGPDLREASADAGDGSRSSSSELDEPGRSRVENMNNSGKLPRFRLALRKRANLIALVVVGTIHLTLLQYFVPLSAVFSDRPIQGVDFDLHIGQVFRVVESLENEHRAWNYDVQLLAGQPEGTITDAGSKGWELWTFALHHYFGLSRELAFNSFVLLVMLACPALLYLAAHLWRFGRTACVAVAGMFTTLWYFDSFVHWLWFVGMVSWALASCLAMVTLALFYRFTEDRNYLWVVPCSFCLGIGLLIHPYTFFALCVPLTFCYMRHIRRMSLREHTGVAMMVIVALAMNGFWLHNAYLNWHYVLNSAFFAQARPEFLLCDLLSVMCSAADTGVIGSRAGFRFLFGGLGLGGLWLWRTEGDRRLAPIGVSLLTLFCMSYFGKFVPGLNQTQPYRQLAPAIWLSIIPAAYCVQRVVEGWKLNALSSLGKIVMSVGAFALVQELLTSQVMYFLPRAIPDPEPLLDGTRAPLNEYGFWAPPNLESHVHYGLPHPTMVELGVREVVDWVASNVPPRSRIMIEGGMLGERLAWRTDHEILGGFVERNVQHVDANFFRTYQNVVASAPELARFKHIYAVNWAITNRPEFERYTDLWELVAKIGGRNIYRARSHSSAVLRGSGEVTALQNRLDVKGSLPNETVVLSYHFHEALRCRPDCRVERERFDVDRVGMIRIPAPHPPDFRIFNSYSFASTNPEFSK